MEVVEYTSTALQTILSSWKEIGYDDLQFTEKQKNLVTLLHNLCDPIIEQERAEHKRLIEEKARLSKLIQALSNTLETQEFEHPPEGTLLVIVDEMTNRQIFLQRCVEGIEQLTELCRILGIALPPIVIKEATAVTRLNREIEIKKRLIEKREETISGAIAKLKKRPGLQPETLDKNLIYNYTPGALGYQESIIFELLGMLNDSESLSDSPPPSPHQVKNSLRFKKKSPRGKIAATPEDPKVPPKFVKKSNSFIIKDKDEEDGPKPVQRSSSQIFGSLRKKSIAQRRERVNQSNKQKLPPSEDAEGENLRLIMWSHRRNRYEKKPHRHEMIALSQLQIQPVIENANKMFFVEEPVDKLDTEGITQMPDLYKQMFHRRSHLNFIVKNEAKPEEEFVYSILVAPSPDGTFHSLITNKKTSKFSKEMIGNIRDSATLREIVGLMLQKRFPGHIVYPIYQPNFEKQLLTLEIKHPQQKTTLKIALLYSNGTETTLQDFFNHKKVSQEYIDFLNLIGTRISLKGWKKYRGDFGKESEQDSYYTEWRNIQIMFHVCHWMDAEQHRRLIGNDVVVIIFNDSPNPFVPDPLDSIGTVPQIFGVVSLRFKDYRVAFFSRPNIKPYRPHLCPNHLWTPTQTKQFKDFLLTKAYNGYIQTLKCPPMNRLYEVPRGEALTKIISDFPIQDEKYFKRLEENEKKRSLIQFIATEKDPFMLLCFVNKLNTNSVCKNPQLIFGLSDQERQTRLSLFGEFDVSIFFLAGINPNVHLFSIQLFDMDTNGPELASAQINMLEICQQLGKPFSIQLRDTTSNAFGSIEVLFKGSGRGSELCGKCDLFIAFEKAIRWDKTVFHASCLSCQICMCDIGGQVFKIRQPEFNYQSSKQSYHLFCSKCHALKYGDEGHFHTSDGLTETRARREFESPHNWKREEAKPITTCSFCGEYLDASKNLLKTVSCHSCSECKYICHKECMEFVPDDCSKDPKFCTIHSSILQSERRGIGESKKVTKVFAGVTGDKAGSSSKKVQQRFNLTIAPPPVSTRPGYDDHSGSHQTRLTIPLIEIGGDSKEEKSGEERSIETGPYSPTEDPYSKATKSPKRLFRLSARGHDFAKQFTDGAEKSTETKNSQRARAESGDAPLPRSNKGKDDPSEGPMPPSPGRGKTTTEFDMMDPTYFSLRLPSTPGTPTSSDRDQPTVHTLVLKDVKNSESRENTPKGHGSGGGHSRDKTTSRVKPRSSSNNELRAQKVDHKHGDEGNGKGTLKRKSLPAPNTAIIAPRLDLSSPEKSLAPRGKDRSGTKKTIAGDGSELKISTKKDSIPKSPRAATVKTPRRTVTTSQPSGSREPSPRDETRKGTSSKKNSVDTNKRPSTEGEDHVGRKGSSDKDHGRRKKSFGESILRQTGGNPASPKRNPSVDPEDPPQPPRKSIGGSSKKHSIGSDAPRSPRGREGSNGAVTSDGTRSPTKKSNSSKASDEPPKSPPTTPLNGTPQKNSIFNLLDRQQQSGALNATKINQSSGENIPIKTPPPAVAKKSNSAKFDDTITKSPKDEFGSPKSSVAAPRKSSSLKFDDSVITSRVPPPTKKSSSLKGSENDKISRNGESSEFKTQRKASSGPQSSEAYNAKRASKQLDEKALADLGIAVDKSPSRKRTKHTKA